jgi:hypothetical protein
VATRSPLRIDAFLNGRRRAGQKKAIPPDRIARLVVGYRKYMTSGRRNAGFATIDRGAFLGWRIDHDGGRRPSTATGED